MKTELVRVPFEVELAKKIQNGEVEGRIVTRDGRNARVVCWDMKVISKAYHILVLIDNGNEEVTWTYSNKGFSNIELESKNDLMLEVPEYMTFKDGDVLVDIYENIFIYNGKRKDGTIGCYAAIIDELEFRSDSYTFFTCEESCRKATEEEKQKLIDALRESTDTRATEYLKRFFGIEEKKECEFKPFDKVLVRDNYCEKWSINFFSYMKNEDEYIYCCLSQCWKQCIPYEGNEKLLGTNNSPE